MVVTRVSDNGPGIPAKLRRKIFGRFVRLGNELERVQTGTGLGLFIVRTLVRRMQGKINVRGRGSQPGTVFEVELPGATPPNRPSADASDSERYARVARPEGSAIMADEPKHILVVEDEGHLAIGIKYNLEAEGYRASVAGDGPTALKMLEESPGRSTW